MPLEVKRYLIIALPYTLCSTLAAFIIWGEDVRKYLLQFLAFILIASATQTATYQVGDEAVRFPLEVISGLLVAGLVFRKPFSWIVKIYATSYFVGIVTLGTLLPPAMILGHIPTCSFSDLNGPWLFVVELIYISMVGISLLLRKIRLPALSFLYTLKESTMRMWPVLLAIFIQMVVFTGLAGDYFNQVKLGSQSSLGPALTGWLNFSLFFLSILIILLFIHYSRREMAFAAQEALSDNITEMINTIRGQRHDFLNHLQVINILYQQNKHEALGEYLNEMLHESSRYNEILKIDNPILSALINAKITQAELRGIKLETDIGSGFPGLPIASMDIARILGNLIDNALDAVESAAVDKIVNLQVYEEGPFIISRVSNPWDGNREELEKTIKKGLSTKGAGHSGLGVYICQVLARKMHGRCDYTLEPGRITFTLTIPIPA